MQLFKASPNGIERLEISDNENDKITRIVTLENCVKIMRDPYPPNVLHIITKTAHIQLYSSDDVTVKQWKCALQSIAFKEKALQGGTPIRNGNIEEDNDLYCSSNSEGIFTVTLVSTEASIKCGLSPIMYTLKLSSTEIQLEKYEQPIFIVAKWPYRFVRKYGYRDGKFTFEAGRKCDTGEGIFKLDNVNPKEIFRFMALKMKSMKKLAISCDSSNTDVNRLPIQLGAVLPGSRSPLSHATQNSSDETESNLFVGSISGSDTSNVSFSSSTSVKLNEHGSPKKPPRRIISPALEINNLSFKTTLEQMNHSALNVSSVFIHSPYNFDKLNHSSVPANCSNLSSRSDQEYERVEDITEAWRKLGINDVNHTEKSVSLHIDPKKSNMTSTNYDTLDFFRINQRTSSEYKTILPINFMIETPHRKKYTSDDYEFIGEPSESSITIREKEIGHISNDLDSNANYMPTATSDEHVFRRVDNSSCSIAETNMHTENTLAINSQELVCTICENNENEKVQRISYTSVTGGK